LNRVTPLSELLYTHHPDLDEQDKNFMKELVLWALVEFKKLSKKRFSEGFTFNDLVNGYWSDVN
jgi:magnesium chelatase subunit I